jgi:polar amino acid transport system substrate-binding protein
MMAWGDGFVEQALRPLVCRCSTGGAGNSMVRRRYMPRLQLPFVLGMVLLLVVACGGGSEGSGDGGGDLLQEVKDRGVLRVSTNLAYPPQSFQTRSGEFKGFDIDVAEEIARRMGVKVEWQTPAWEVIAAGNWNGRWDVSVASMTVTSARKEVLYFTPAYYYTPAAAAVHEENTSITNLETDLDGKRIGVCWACTYEQYLDRTLTIPGEEIEFVVDNPQIQTYDNPASAIQDLELGDGVRLDAVMSALPTLQEAVEEGKPIKIVGDSLYDEPLAAAIDKEAPSDPKPLLDEISRIIEEMHQDGTLSELSKKWYDGTDLTKMQ